MTSTTLLQRIEKATAFNESAARSKWTEIINRPDYRQNFGKYIIEFVQWQHEQSTALVTKLAACAMLLDTYSHCEGYTPKEIMELEYEIHNLAGK